MTSTSSSFLLEAEGTVNFCHEMGAELCRYYEVDDGDKAPVKPVQKAGVIKEPAMKSFHDFLTEDTTSVFLTEDTASTVTQKEVQQYFVRQASLEPMESEEQESESEVPDFIKMTNLTHDTTFAQVKELLIERINSDRTDFSMPGDMDLVLKDLNTEEMGELSDFLADSRDAPLIASVDFMQELESELKTVAFKRLGEYKLLSPMTFTYFFRRFKADDAKYSIDNFHRESMEFKPQRTERWAPQENGWIQRNIEMLCKVENVPSWMKQTELMHVHSQVRLKKIGQGIWVMHKKTKTTGAPLCDTFVLHHVWEITQRRGLNFESYFGIEWIKTTWTSRLVNPMIESRTLKDAETYDHDYFDHLFENAATSDRPINAVDSPEPKRCPETSRTTAEGTPPPPSAPYFWEGRGKATGWHCVLARRLRIRKEKDHSRHVQGFVHSGEHVFVSKIEDGCAFVKMPYEGWITFRDARGYWQALPVEKTSD